MVNLNIHDTLIRLWPHGTSAEKDNIKRIVRKIIQTLIKVSTTQNLILKEKSKTQVITLKKVNKPMIENLRHRLPQ